MYRLLYVTLVVLVATAYVLAFAWWFYMIAKDMDKIQARNLETLDRDWETVLLKS